MSNASPTNDYVVDTVALILRLERRAMGSKARDAFNAMEQGGARLYVPAMVFAEILYLAQRKRITATLDDVNQYVQGFADCYETPLNFAVVSTADAITDIPELHDRLIAATAIHLKAPLITNDARIHASLHLRTLWD